MQKIILFYSLLLFCTLQTLFLHGQKDNFIEKIRHAREIMQQNPNKSFEILSVLVHKNHESAPETEKILLYEAFIENLQKLGYNTLQLEFTEKLLKLLEKDIQSEKYLRRLIELGEVESRIASNDKATEHFLKALEICEVQKNNKEKAKINNLIGIALRGVKSYKRADKHFRDALFWAEKFNNTLEKANAYNNIGGNFYAQTKLDSAFFYFSLGFNIRKKNALDYDVAKSLNNLALVHKRKGNFNKALEMLLEALEILKSQSNTGDLAHLYDNIGDTYYVMGEHEKSVDFHLKGLHFAEQSNLKDARLESYRSLIEAYLAKGEHERAVFFMEKYANIKDTIFDEQRARQAEQLEAKYEFERQKKEIALGQAQNQSQKTVIYALVAVSVLGIMLLMLLYGRFLSGKKIRQLLENQNIAAEKHRLDIEKQRDELLMLNEEINRQKNAFESQNIALTTALAEINTQNEAIKASIHYARRIQTALLPTLSNIKKHIPDLFIFYKPRDIVSGDFFWFVGRQNFLYLVVADCTGHGVPGAFMSMLGDAFLHQIVNSYPVSDPSEILTMLHKQIYTALKQNESDNKDGMDVAVCVIDKMQKKLLFSGAKSHLFAVCEGEHFFIKGNSRSVGGSESEKEKPEAFKKHEFLLEKKCHFYLYSDGFQDQFGGEENKKYMSKKFRNFLFSIHQETPENQYFLLEEELKKWKNGHSQTDDILVVGFQYCSKCCCGEM